VGERGVEVDQIPWYFMAWTMTANLCPTRSGTEVYLPENELWKTGRIVHR